MSAIGAIGGYGSIGGYYSIYQNRNPRDTQPSGTEPVSPVSRAETIPVQPVSKVPSVHRGAVQPAEEDQFPTMREGADPAEMAVRARIQYLDGEAEDMERDLLG